MCINRNYQIRHKNLYLDYLIDPSFQKVNTLFVLPFGNNKDTIIHTSYYLPKVEIKDYNFMILGKDFFDQTNTNHTRSHKNIRKIPTGQGDDQGGVCFLHYPCFK